MKALTAGSVLFLGLLLCSGCGSNSEEDTPTGPAKELIGRWKLVSNSQMEANSKMKNVIYEFTPKRMTMHIDGELMLTGKYDLNTSSSPASLTITPLSGGGPNTKAVTQKVEISGDTLKLSDEDRVSVYKRVE